MSAPAVTSLSCPNCGAPIVLRTMDRAESVACANCATVLDARDPTLRILQRYEAAQAYSPRIPLGTRGTLKGTKWEVVGFQVRSSTIDGTTYYWEEYVLFNPYDGFRYLTQYDGHWNDVQVVKAAPTERTSGRQPFVELHGERFKHFQTATATTTFVIGEFPWQVRVGDHTVGRDFVSPPRMLSEESSDGEVTWSLGTYVEPAQIWSAFGLPGKPPTPRGVFANQPNDRWPAARALGRRFVLFAAILLGVMIVRLVTASRATVYTGSYAYNPVDATDSTAFVTPSFDVRGHTSNLEIETDAYVDNQWAYIDYALVNEATGETRDVGREVSYFHGYDSDGSWSEGGPRDRVVLASVPAGRYFLRVHAEGDEAMTGRIPYTITVRRDVPRASYFLIALVLLGLPPLFSAMSAGSMEGARWRESDYAPESSDDSSSDDD